MEKVNLEEALALFTQGNRRIGAGRPNYGKDIVEGFLAVGELVARERYADEKTRKAKMLSIKGYIKEAGLEDEVWVLSDGASIIFTNMKMAAKADAATKKAITDAHKAYQVRYANVGKKKQ